MTNDKEQKAKPEASGDKPGKASPAKTPPAAAGGGGKREAAAPVARNITLPLSVIALLGVVGAAVGGYFIWHEVQRQEDWQQQAFGRIEARGQGLDQRLDSFKDRLDADLATTERGRRELQDAQRKLETTQDALQNSLTVLRAQLGRSRNDWTLAEIQYLLQLANQRVQLERDTQTAAAALTSADQRLQELADPGFSAVREQIAQELAALKAVALPDRPGIALALDSLSGQVAGLPLRSTRAAPGQPDSAAAGSDAGSGLDDWKRLPMLIWQELRSLVVVRRDDEPVGPMLAPEQQYFLRQNLDLKLNAARLAALQSDNENYRASLLAARAWLDEYFAADDSQVTAMRAELERLAGIDVHPALPDISASLRLLRQRMRLAELATESAVKKRPDAAPAADGDAP